MRQQQETWLITVVQSLQAAKGKWRCIAEATGIPYDTLTKIALGRVSDPRVSNVQTLHDYFENQQVDAVSAESSRASH